MRRGPRNGGDPLRTGYGISAYKRGSFPLALTLTYQQPWPRCDVRRPTRRVLRGGVRDVYEINAGRSTLSPALLGMVHWTPSALGVCTGGDKEANTGAVSSASCCANGKEARERLLGVFLLPATAA
jgi:hypothetical protein